MKFSTTRIIQFGVVVSFLLLAVVLAFRTFEPPKMKWVSVSSPAIVGRQLTISAETHRRPIDGCTNGPQMDLRRDGAIVRLPVPTRVIRGNLSTYTSELVTPLKGKYAVRLRESFICPTGTQVIESAWIEAVAG